MRGYENERAIEKPANRMENSSAGSILFNPRHSRQVTYTGCNVLARCSKDYTRADIVNRLHVENSLEPTA